MNYCSIISLLTYQFRINDTKIFQVRRDPNICANVISYISYGDRSVLKVDSDGRDVKNDIFTLPLNTNQEIFVFNGTAQLLSYLTFDWFKLYVMCFEQPWICDSYPIKLID